MVIRFVFAVLLILAVSRPAFAEVINFDSGSLKQLNLPSSYKVLTSTAGAFVAKKSAPDNETIEVNTFKADVDFSKLDLSKSVVSAQELQTFNTSKNSNLSMWSRAESVSCRRIGSIATLWTHSAGALKQMRELPGGKRGCANVTAYTVKVLAAPRAGHCSEICYTASEEGFTNAWNEDAKSKKTDEMRAELEAILKKSIWR